MQRAYQDYVKPIIPEDDRNLIPYIESTIINHDKQKYNPFSFVAYLNHFYLNDTNPQEFSNATKRHTKASPHHWEYWLDQNNDFKDPSSFELPDGLDYKQFMKASYIEMLADWFSFNFVEHTSKTAEKFHEWYEKNRSTIIIHPDLVEWLNNMINQLIQKSKDLQSMKVQPEIITNENEMDELVDNLVEDIRITEDNPLLSEKDNSKIYDPINFLICDEEEAIKGYTDFLTKLIDLVPYSLYEEAKKTIDHIIQEEQEHIKELKEVQMLLIHTNNPT